MARRVARGEERDQQRSRVYEAEGVLSKYAKNFETIHEVRAYVDHIVSLKWWKKHAPPFAQDKVEVSDGRGTRHARGGGKWSPLGSGGLFAFKVATINIPRWARNSHIVLHELAHVLTNESSEERKVRVYQSGHGWQYCQMYLKLVRNRMGRAAYDDLRKSFREHRVKYGPPFKVNRPERPCRECGAPTRGTYCGGCFRRNVAAKRR